MPTGSQQRDVTPDEFARQLGGRISGSEVNLTIRAPRTAPQDVEKTIRDLAAEHGVDPDLAVAVAKKESSLNPKAVGDSGKAVGTFQLHAGAAEDTGVN